MVVRTPPTERPASFRATPPGLPGLPLLGNILDFRRDHIEIFRRSYERYGDVFSIQLGPQRGAVLVGPRHHEFFFSSVDDLLTVPEVYRFVVPMFGEVAMAARDPDIRRQHVELMHSAFRGQRLAGHAKAMLAETSRWLDQLGSEGEFEVWDVFEALSMSIAASALMGPEVRARIGEFRPLLGDLARGMDFVLPPNLPLRKFRRRDRARALLTEMIVPILAERGRDPGGRPDFLQALVDDPTLDAHGRGGEVLVGMALCTIFTGYITTAAQMSWALVLLLHHPEYARSVLAELDEEAAGSTDGWVPRPSELPRLLWALKEAVRLRPVMSHYARTTARDYHVNDFVIPRGWLTMLCPAVAHRLPDVFTDPDRYDPERFGPGREEDRRHPYALIGFSAGFYRCPGAAFGMQEMLTVLALLLRSYRLEIRSAPPGAMFELGVSRPPSPTVVRYRRRAPGDPA